MSAIAEETRVHTRILKCALEEQDARAYWQHASETTEVDAEKAFEGYWFGARSLARVKVLLTNFRHRFDAFPPSLSVLHNWVDMSPDTRRLICHWHLQLSDPMYREFSGELLAQRRASHKPELTRDIVLSWVDPKSDAWTMATKIQFASKLLSAAYAAGLVGSTRDPRPLLFPRVPDDALEYLLYLLRNIRFEGSLTDNPYLRSVGLDADFLGSRLRSCPNVGLQRSGSLAEFSWRHESLEDWASRTGKVAA